MTQEDKQLLIQDLCARLPYDVVVRCYFVDGGGEEVLDTDDIADLLYNEENGEFPMYKPYLRSMSSMTEEEVDEFTQFDVYSDGEYIMPNYEAIDWLLEHHFDYRGLIERGLALEAPEGMYN